MTTPDRLAEKLDEIAVSTAFKKLVDGVIARPEGYQSEAIWAAFPDAIRAYLESTATPVPGVSEAMRGEIALQLQQRNRFIDMPTMRAIVDAALEAAFQSPPSEAMVERAPISGDDLQAALLLLVKGCRRDGIGRFVFDMDGVTVAGEDAGDWRVVVEHAEAAVQSPPAGVRVKALEWTSPSNGRDSLVKAETLIGVYRVWTHHEADGTWFWDNEAYERVWGDTASISEAKAAAQADYEARIRSALSLAPVEAAKPHAGDPICRQCATQEYGDHVPEECTCSERRTGAPVEAVATEPVAWQTRMRPTGAKVWGDWHFGKMTADDTDGWEWEERALGVIAPTGDSGALREALVDVTASLAAAISLLERTPKAKRAAPSDKMFDQMLLDYSASLARARYVYRASGEKAP